MKELLNIFMEQLSSPHLNHFFTVFTYEILLPLQGTTGRPKGVTLTHHNVVNNSFLVGYNLDYTKVNAGSLNLEELLFPDYLVMLKQFDGLLAVSIDEDVYDHRRYNHYLGSSENEAY